MWLFLETGENGPRRLRAFWRLLAQFALSSVLSVALILFVQAPLSAGGVSESSSLSLMTVSVSSFVATVLTLLVIPALYALIYLAGAAWFALVLLAMLSVIFLPRQFQVMVVENVDERHVQRATWAFPAYLLLINLFVLPIALGGLLHFGPGRADPETFVLSLPLANGAPALALAAFIGGLSAATGMVIVEAIAVSTMVSNDLVMPLLLRSRRRDDRRDLSRTPLAVRRVVIVALLLSLAILWGCSNTILVTVPPRMDLKNYGTLGIVDGDVFLGSRAIGATNLIATIIAMSVIERNDA